MPSPLCQLALVIQLDIRDLARIPAAILFVPEQGWPKALEVVARFRIHAFHFPKEEIFQHLLVQYLWMLVDGFASDREDRSRLKAHRHWRSIVTKVVEEVFKVLCRRLRGLFVLECAVWRRPLRPAWVLLPGNTVPKVEELHDTVWECSDSSFFGLECYLLHLECCERGMVIDAALSE